MLNTCWLKVVKLSNLFIFWILGVAMSEILAIKPTFFWKAKALIGPCILHKIYNYLLYCVHSNKFPLGALTPKRPRERISYGKKRARRRKGAAASQECNKGHRCWEEGGGRRACDWRPFNEKRLNQARTGLFIQNLCENDRARRRLRARGNFYP